MKAKKTTLGHSSGQGYYGVQKTYKGGLLPPSSAPMGSSLHGGQENLGVNLPAIDRRSRPRSVAEGMQGARGTRKGSNGGSTKDSLGMPMGGMGRRARSTELRPAWVSKPSDEMNDLQRLEERFRMMHSRESASLETKLVSYVQEHHQLMNRRTKISPLVVCVLDQFASTGGLLKTIAGAEVSFAIQVKYAFAGHLGEGGEDLRRWVDTSGGFTCVLAGPATVHADVVYQGAGTYVFFYKASVAGNYKISVRLGNGDVPGSPFDSMVSPGKTDTGHCGVSGLGLLCAEAGVEACFQITSRDQHGNVLNTGGDRYDVSLTGPVCFNATVIDMDNGTYNVKYNTIMCGDYYVTIRREGVTLPGSPYVLSVIAGRTHGASCTAVGEGLRTAFAGHDAEFIIEARDIIGNQRVVGDDAFHVAIEGPSTPQITVFDRDDGTYLVSYVVAETGQYFIRVSLDGQQIAGSPFEPAVMPGRVVAVRCTGVGRGLTRSYAGEDAKFTIESRDVHRNKTTSGSRPFLVTVRGAVIPQVHCIQGENGEYNYSYRTAKAGVYFVGVLYDGVDIGGSPFKLTVDPGPCHANGCSASGPGIQGSYTMVETSFLIQARDYFGNNRTTGGDVFNIDIGGTASAKMRLRDNHNGTYTVAYTPEIGGDYFISVKVDGVDIQDSPFTVSSDAMPRENYLEMYRSMEPDFGRHIQSQMLGVPDKGLEAKQDARRKRRASKQPIEPMWDLNIKLLSGKDLVAKDTMVEGTYGTTFTYSSDPYVVFKMGDETVRSTTIEKELNPTWNEELIITVKNRMQRLEVEVFDRDVEDEDDTMGSDSISIVDLIEGKPKMVTAKLKTFDEGGNVHEDGLGEVTLCLTLTAAAGQVGTRALR